jgi:hypothetical protein
MLLRIWKPTWRILYFKQHCEIEDFIILPKCKQKYYFHSTIGTTKLVFILQENEMSLVCDVRVIVSVRIYPYLISCSPPVIYLFLLYVHMYIRNKTIAIGDCSLRTIFNHCFFYLVNWSSNDGTLLGRALMRHGM